MVASTSSRVTTDHNAIRCWAEQRAAKPVVVLAGKVDDDPGTVRLEFPGSRDNALKEISWQEWFAKFERSKLALLYQEQTADGERSSFCKFVRREVADQVESAVGGRGRSAARRGSPRGEAAALEGRPAEPEISPERRKDSESTAPKKPTRKPRQRQRAGMTLRSSSRRKPGADSQPAVTAVERTIVQEPESQVGGMTMRSDEDPPIPIPPGEDPPPPIQEPPDKPVIAPDSPVREPGPAEPRRL
jgi:hypothetical protein